jgi:mono/diheme cytochrome c family protein
VLKSTLLACVAVLMSSLTCAQQSDTAPSEAQAGGKASPVAADTMSPVQLADSAPKGTLKNPYKDSDAAAVKAGGNLFQAAACSGCHGGGGGGGMCPPLIDGVWIYGGDDDTLFRLFAYGSQTLQSKGYTRKAQENVVAPMPAMGQIVHTADDLWRILAWVRSKYSGPPECKFGCKG